MSVLLTAALMLGPGSVSKFEDHKVDADYVSSAKLEDIERCLIDIDGPGLPAVYRQPDRENDVMLLWTTKGPISAPVTFRVDLSKAPEGTKVRAWMPAKWVARCAPIPK